VAVEPDAENFRILEDNLRPYGGRYTAVKSGVWSHSTGLVVEPNSDFGDGREWARTVREARSDETPDVQATDIGRLLRESGHERISILKIDIEGSERNVFANGTPDWIDKVDNMVIELHGKDCEDVVHPAMAGQGFAVSRCDELTVFKRPR
jgi:FkbM family methyltransferase